MKLTLRLCSTLAFVCAMPVLALAPQFDAWSRLLRVPEVGSGAESRPEVDQSPARPRPPDSVPTRAANDQVLTPPIPTVRRLPSPDIVMDDTRCEKIQTKLQDLGVDYFLLERATGTAMGYRFHCRMTIPGTSVYLRPFEAIDNDPLAAMERVLRDVEQWAARRDAATSLR